jgi:hypothetical protein
MKMQSKMKAITLCCAVLVGAPGLAGFAQAPKIASSTNSESYIIKLKAPQIDSADVSAIRRHNVIPAAVYWDNLYNVGKVSLLGSTQDGDTAYRVVIVEGVSAQQAQMIADSDPNVKAGAVTAEVTPFHVNLTKNNPSRTLPTRR